MRLSRVWWLLLYKLAFSFPFLFWSCLSALWMSLSFLFSQSFCFVLPQPVTLITRPLTCNLIQPSPPSLHQADYLRSCSTSASTWFITRFGGSCALCGVLLSDDCGLGATEDWVCNWFLAFRRKISNIYLCKLHFVCFNEILFNFKDFNGN